MTITLSSEKLTQYGFPKLSRHFAEIWYFYNDHTDAWSPVGCNLSATGGSMSLGNMVASTTFIQSASNHHITLDIRLQRYCRLNTNKYTSNLSVSGGQRCNQLTNKCLSVYLSGKEGLRLDRNLARTSLSHQLKYPQVQYDKLVRVQLIKSTFRLQIVVR